MARRVLGLLVLASGCLDANPRFIDPTATDAMTDSRGTTTQLPGETTESRPADETDTESAPPTTATTGVQVTTTSETISSTSVEPSCGDGDVDEGEECDDGDDDDLDECSNACVTNVCGDGVVQMGEDCDDGNVSDDDACLNDCTKASCGDGHVEAMVEACDDGNAVDFDGCQSTCTPSRKLVFVSSKNFAADLGGLDGADIKCQQLAMAADIPGEFRAWLSSGNESPLSRMTPSALGYARHDGAPIADSWNELLSGTLQAAIDQTETGAPPLAATGACKPSSVFTNTFPNGTPGLLMDDCFNWGVTEGPTLFGDWKAKDKAWTQDCNGGCDAEAPIYCVQQ